MRRIVGARRDQAAACLHPGTRRRRVAIGALASVAMLAIPAVTGTATAGDHHSSTPLTPPVITGSPLVGATLTAQPGSFVIDDDATSATFQYQWLRCDASGAACSPIPDATASSYGVTSADIGATLRVQTVQASDDDDDVSPPLLSAATAVVPAPVLPPGNTTAPAIAVQGLGISNAVIQGAPQVHNSLIATTGTWSGTPPITFTYQWLRCDAAGNACVVIPGATGRNYRPRSADVGHTLRVVVTASNGAGSVSAKSTPTKPVTLVPVLHKSELVRSLGGSVRVRMPGGNQFISLHGQKLIPDGSAVDTTAGTVQLTVAADAHGHTSTASLRGASVTVKQRAGGRPITDLHLVGLPTGCPKNADIVRARRRRPLWVHDRGGRFSTKGHYASAIVRGTTWETTELCAGTLVAVIDGEVSVRDLVKHRTVLVTAGHQYLARAPKPADPGI
ncbi:MAG: hypothetical protein QOD66_781 [Solirubrobacteraceae bacterium]|jgi:hypothetical protein|nr:hypothetical protein [Solirubrobacteraceae bacterium]